MTQNIMLSSAKFILIDVFGDLVYFPIWWYTKGMKKFILAFWYQLKSIQNRLGVSIWLKNLFRPMYAQADWQGRVISFFIRLFQIITRSIALIVVFIVFFVVFVLWALLPVIVVYQIYTILINL